MWTGVLEKVDDCHFRIPRSYKKGMRVDGVIVADDKLIKDIRKDLSCEQVANVAFLPGIVGNSLAMPDAHWGYGFPIGGVAATDIEAGGVVSPGGVGFDINCGIRYVRSNLEYDEIKDKVDKIVSRLFSDVPTGVGSKGDIRVSAKEEKNILLKGSRWCVEQGYGVEADLEATEENGEIKGADVNAVSERAYERGKAQSGTLGSGNHFIEVQVVEEIFDRGASDRMGLREGQIGVMIHSGSRGLGYQICDEYSKGMIRFLDKFGINLPDRQLACVPVNSPEGKDYLGAMRCAANYAWANRQNLMHLARLSFEKIFGRSWKDLGMDLVYDVAHNIAKIERHKVNGKEKLLCVHRKGATRAFGPGVPGVPEKYKDIGQPVIIPGDMGRNSYILAGTAKAMEESFGSTCHGAGRVKSRTEAAKTISYSKLIEDLKQKGIIVMASGRGTVVEEAPEAYKDVNDVVSVVCDAGLAKKVCKLRSLGVIKG